MPDSNQIRHFAFVGGGSCVPSEKLAFGLHIYVQGLKTRSYEKAHIPFIRHINSFAQRM